MALFYFIIAFFPVFLAPWFLWRSKVVIATKTDLMDRPGCIPVEQAWSVCTGFTASQLHRTTLCAVRQGHQFCSERGLEFEAYHLVRKMTKSKEPLKHALNVGYFTTSWYLWFIQIPFWFFPCQGCSKRALPREWWMRRMPLNSSNLDFLSSPEEGDFCLWRFHFLAERFYQKYGLLGVSIVLNHMAAVEGFVISFRKDDLAAKMDWRVIMFPRGIQKGSTLPTHLYDLCVVFDRRAKTGVGESPLRALLLCITANFRERLLKSGW